MLLPEHFTFTQQNLQDYLDCPYRFYLKEIRKLEWPAIESEPVREQEALMQLGTRFHLMCQQYFSGVPLTVLEKQTEEPLLAEWWQNFLSLNLDAVSMNRTVEKLVSIPFEGFRLAAKFDLVLRSTEDEVTIYDWKTSQHQPKRQSLLERMQSKVYPFMTLQTGLLKVTSSEILHMVYWYPAFPRSPIEFQYSTSQYEEDRDTLEALVKKITRSSENDFTMTEKEKICTYCRFRSHCARGISAGNKQGEFEPDELEVAFDLDFDAL